MAVAIVTDSACDLDSAFVRERRLQVVPIGVRFGREWDREGEDLSPDLLSERLRTAADAPTTVPPSPGQFLEVYRRCFERGFDSVVSIHLSGGLSQTVRSAQTAARMTDGPVAVVDSQSVGLGLGLLVWWAARRCEDEASAATVVDEVKVLSEKIRIVFTPKTLSPLARGGRIGHAARLIGQGFEGQPILSVEKGTVRVVAKVGRHFELNSAIMEGLKASIPSGTPVLGAVTGLGANSSMDVLERMILSEYTVLARLKGFLSPAVAAHAGLGTWGAALVPLNTEEVYLWKESE